MQKRAHERGRAVIDSDFLTEIRDESMLWVARCIRGFGFEELSMEAFEVAKAKMRRLPPPMSRAPGAERPIMILREFMLGRVK